jgi:hypothetical protein
MRTQRIKKVIGSIVTLFFVTSLANAQRPEVTISLNETFFDSLLDAVYQNAPPLEFSIASSEAKRTENTASSTLSFGPRGAACRETIQLLRESNGVRTAVRFRDGKILAPLAFSGNYNPPFVGCVPFSGFAETVIDLEFDQQNQRVIARARVLHVSLNGTGGVGGTLIAKMVQGSIDKKVNPIEIFTMDKISFLFPIRKDVNLRMKAASVRHEVVNGALNIVIAYDFVKA